MCKKDPLSMCRVLPKNSTMMFCSSTFPLLMSPRAEIILAHIYMRLYQHSPFLNAYVIFISITMDTRHVFLLKLFREMSGGSMEET